jgi:hypothetical protein
MSSPIDRTTVRQFLEIISEHARAVINGGGPTGVRINMVASAAWIKKIDDWRRQQSDLPNISEAIRRLVEIGLEASKKGGKHGR